MNPGQLGAAALRIPFDALRGLLPQQVKDGLKPYVNPVRYKLMLQFQPRKNRIYSQFDRFPHQHQALIDKVVPVLLDNDPTLAERPLEIAVFACCTGEEVITLSHRLRAAFPKLKLRIRGYDLVSDVVAHARTGRYSQEQVYSGPFVRDDFVQAVFERDGDEFRVRAALLDGVSFEVGDITDGADVGKHAPFDLVFAQNVLFHLPRPVARQAFHHLSGAVRPGGALVISGMDADMRIQLTGAAGLIPLEYLVEEIHEDARVDRGATWSYQYWGREPFSRNSPDWLRRYSTIFLKGRAEKPS